LQTNVTKSETRPTRKKKKGNQLRKETVDNEKGKKKKTKRQRNKRKKNTRKERAAQRNCELRINKHRQTEQPKESSFDAFKEAFVFVVSSIDEKYLIVAELALQLQHVSWTRWRFLQCACVCLLRDREHVELQVAPPRQFS